MFAVLNAFFSACATVANQPMSAATRQATYVLASSPPEPFRGPVKSADRLVLGAATLDPVVIRRLARQPDVLASGLLSIFSVNIGGKVMTVAAGDSADLRAYFPSDVARNQDLWRRFASGQAIVNGNRSDAGSVGELLQLDQANRLPRATIAARVGVPLDVDVVVNELWAKALQAPTDNALILSAPRVSAFDGLEAALGTSIQVVALGGTDHQPAERRAFMPAGAVGNAVGSFTYSPNENGTISIDPAWIRRSIVIGDVPILGRVTCHRVMFNQLRGAMQELLDRGWVNLINPRDFGGCWVPRFIERDPSRGLSLHSWGIAVDLNVSSNQRSTSGAMDRRVVDVMASWGFAWGGTWSDPDPMHFELAALVRQPS